MHDYRRTFPDLPAPDVEAECLSRRLEGLICREMESAEGRISFARYMELALYAPGLGYYSAGHRKFGEWGDFVTAPELSPLFARCLARQCHQVLQALEKGIILEVGAGSGRMACDLLRELEFLQSLPEHYYILETSADLRERQQALLRVEAPHLLTRISWLDSLPRQGDFCGVILANEVLDAMPVHRFCIDEQGASELYVGWRDNGFVWYGGNLSDPALAARIQTVTEDRDDEPFPAGFESEINLAAEAWVRSMAAVLGKGMVLVSDYGFPRREFYHPQRSMGTLMCHYRQRAHADPLILTGLQDITSHIDFTAIAEAACAGGLSVSGYTTQAHFLLACSLTEMAAAPSPDEPRQRLALAQQVKKLTLPSEMGELFKFIALCRGIDIPLLGFSLRDLRAKL